jgi:hypothetical protein
MLDGRLAQHDIADFQSLGQRAGGARANHMIDAGQRVEDVPGLHGELRLAVTTVGGDDVDVGEMRRLDRTIGQENASEPGGAQGGVKERTLLRQGHDDQEAHEQMPIMIRRSAPSRDGAPCDSRRRCALRAFPRARRGESRQ